MEKILLLGGGGHCKVIIDILEGFDFIILNKGEDSVLDLQKFYNEGIKNCFVSVGSVGDVSIRRELFNKSKKIGFSFPNIFSNKSVISDSVILGEGNFVSHTAVINADTKIGHNCIINTGAIIEHDCKIADFVHISPNATVCGNVEIGENSHIGAGAVILQGLKIGKNVMIGAGSVITKNIDDNQKVFGVPGEIR